jgi:polyhydroxyalkanoate synthesis regulator phasin
MLDAVKNYLSLASGVTEVTRQRATAAAKALAASGEATAEQVSNLADELLATSRNNRDAVLALVRYEVDRALNRLGLATADEIASLQRRVTTLESAIDKIVEASGADTPGSSGRSPEGTEAAARQTNGGRSGVAAKSAPQKVSPAPTKSATATKAPAKAATKAASPAKAVSPANASPAKSSPAKSGPAKSSPAKSSPAKSATPAKSSPAKSAAPAKSSSPAKKAAKKAATTSTASPAGPTAAKKAAKSAPRKSSSNGDS